MSPQRPMGQTAAGSCSQGWLLLLLWLRGWMLGLSLWGSFPFWPVLFLCCVPPSPLPLWPSQPGPLDTPLRLSSEASDPPHRPPSHFPANRAPSPLSVAKFTLGPELFWVSPLPAPPSCTSSSQLGRGNEGGSLLWPGERELRALTLGCQCVHALAAAKTVARFLVGQCRGSLDPGWGGSRRMYVKGETPAKEGLGVRFPGVSGQNGLLC